MLLATKTCPVCLQDFEYPRKQRERKYCSHRCAFRVFGHRVTAASLTPEARKKNGDIRRGTGKTGGYIKLGGRHEHRVVMEEMIGRPLRSDEIVHHTDEVKFNNDPSNLVLTNRADHGRHHNTGRKRPVVLVCKFGHALEGDNIGITSKGARRCIICRRQYDREWKKQRRRELSAGGAAS